MTRLFAALVLTSLSLVASAADKPLPVTVANPVLPVEVSNADPILVRDADNPARNAVTETVFYPNAYAVPAGKRLVIEFVSGFVSSNGGGSAAAVGVFTGKATDSGILNYVHQIPASLLYDAGTQKSFTFSQLTRLYADEGSEVRIGYSGTGTPAQFYLTFTGYLVDM